MDQPEKKLRSRVFVKALLWLAWTCALPAMASDVGNPQEHRKTIWIAPGFYSLHFDRNSGLRDANPGIGFQWEVRPQWSLAVGHFKNSNNKRSNYLGALYMPVELGSLRVGVAFVAFDGYPDMRNGGWFASAIPTLGLYGKDWALNIGGIPELKDRVHGAVSLQLLRRLN
jgi:hypothetical protein